MNLPYMQFLSSCFSIPITGRCAWQSSGCTAGGRGMLCVGGGLLLGPVKDCLGSLKWFQQIRSALGQLNLGCVSTTELQLSSCSAM